MVSMISDDHIFPMVEQFRGYYDNAYIYPYNLNSNYCGVQLLSWTLMIKLKIMILELISPPTPDDDDELQLLVPNLTHLKVGSAASYKLTDSIAMMTNLTTLDMYYDAKYDDYFLTLHSLPSLKNLKLYPDDGYNGRFGRNDYDDWIILKEMPNLESINARPNSKCPLDFSVFACLANLRDIYVEWNDMMIDENIQALTSLKSLKNIYITDLITMNEIYILNSLSISSRLNVHYELYYYEDMPTTYLQSYITLYDSDECEK